MRRLLAGLAAAVALVALAPPAAATPGDPYAPQYYFDDWNVPQLWASGARGQGITIAEIDTGVDASLDVFAGRVLSGKDFGRLGGNGQTDRDQDAYGHGTSMASIMVGRPGQYGIEGLAPGAKLLPIAIPLAGTTDASADDHLPDAIRWAADHGAKIISMSLGGVRRQATSTTSCPEDEQAAIFHALSKGVVVFASSGNRGTTDNAIEEPGVCLGVIAVGATDRTGTVADFSSRHRYLTLSAPGVNIASIGPGGTAYSGDGTSQAAAIASATAALVWSKYPSLSPARLVARLLATLDRHSDTPDPAYGYGTVNAERAVRADVPADAPNPVYALAAPFLAQADTTTPPAPRAMTRAAEPPGTYSVGTAPRLLAPRVLAGLAVALGGLLVLLVLLAGGLVSRRRRRRRAEQPPGPPLPPFVPPSIAGLDGHPIEWRDAWAPEPGPRPD